MGETRKRLSGVQRMVAKQMVRSATTIPHVTTIREIRMDAALLAKEELAERIGHATVMPVIMKAVVAALERFPILNARLDEEEIVYSDEINLGIAVAVGEDLKVPVVRGVQTMSIEEMAAALNEVRNKSRKNSFQISDFRGGTFTISNSGALGGEIFTPIINYPQSGILGIGRIVPKPVIADDGVSVEVGQMMYACLSYDHRIVNGYHAVSFLGEFEHTLADTGKMAH